MKKVRLIIIDDDPLSLLIARKLLQKHLPKAFNYELEVFEDSLKGIDRLTELLSSVSKQDLIVVLLDINMPKMDGWMFLEEMEQKDPAAIIKFFMHSSSLSTTDKIKALSYNRVCEYIAKPLTESKIIDFHLKLSELATCHN